jgi:DNA invertase Pin-like site-specific DNA recombinase
MEAFLSHEPSANGRTSCWQIPFPHGRKASTDQRERIPASASAASRRAPITSVARRGRLNVLLSFAQFEREVTGERIRDKICRLEEEGHVDGRQSAAGL